MVKTQAKPVEALEKAQSGYELLPEDPESCLVLAACLSANQKDLRPFLYLKRRYRLNQIMRRHLQVERFFD